MAELEVVPSAAVPESVDIEFHGTLYNITTQVHGEDVLVIEIEDKETLDRWRGEFAAKYVEDITSKTGNFKKFAVFVRMLQSAVLQQSDSVFVDLLTYQDLEMLKSKKSNGSAARPLPVSNKRYLILTYASEFDRVHYPLPLLAEEQPDPQRLKAVIQQLRQQLQEVQAAQQLAQQGSRQQLQGRQRGGNSSQAGSGDAADALLLSSRVEVLAAQLERERAEHKRELRRKARELQELQEELCRSRDVARDLRLRVKSLEQELADAAAAAAAAAATGAAPRRRTGTSTASGAAAAGAAYRRGVGGIDSSRWSHGSSSYLAGSGKYPVSKYPARTGGSRSHATSAASSGFNSSRGSSPASSRAQSPGSRPWAQGSPRPPRPSSAPPKQRFDPTEYVRQKRAREQQLAAQRSSAGSRGSSPARSSSRGPGGSGASTPRGLMSPVAAARGSSSSAGGGVSRQSSLERRSNDSSLRAAAARDGSRGEYGYLRPTLSSGCNSSSSGVRAVRGSDAARVTPGDVRSSSRHERLGAVYGVADIRSSSRSSSRGRQGHVLENRPASRDRAGAASPGRALQGVRDKLNAFMAKQQQQEPQQQQQQQQRQPGVADIIASPLLPGPAAGAAGDSLAAVAAAGGAAPAAAAAAAAPLAVLASGGSRVFEDASSEIADIDQRLHALQDFLKKAKSSVAAS